MVAHKKNISGDNIDSWVDAVALKLWGTGIQNHGKLISELFNMNKMLSCAGHTMSHMAI
jgi:hypothetical protein